MAEMASRQLASLHELDLDGTIESLLRIYSKDPDLFFFLGTEHVDPSAGPPLPELSALAHQLREVVAHGYQISFTATEAVLQGAGQTIPFRKESADEVRSFLAAVNGVVHSTVGGKDYRGRVASAAEITFLLGNRESWSADELRLQRMMAESPSVLHLADEERRAVQGGTPAYCVHALVKCATRVVQAPSAVFRGLRREGPLKEGHAYCGKPKRLYGNDAQPLNQSLDGFVFVVYADAQGYVFDWDWVQADPSDPSVPSGASERFTSRVEVPTAVLVGVDDLQVGEFQAKGWYSRRGDCIFYYISDSPSYASRVNDELTVFLSFAVPDQMTGCKVKNVSSIWKDVRESDRLREEPQTDIPLVSLLANSYAIQALNGHANHYLELLRHAYSSSAQVQLSSGTEELVSTP
jgi:hypothetical protein